MSTLVRDEPDRPVAQDEVDPAGVVAPERPLAHLVAVQAAGVQHRSAGSTGPVAVAQSSRLSAPTDDWLYEA